MGGLSELGPIDPQFARMPALAVKHSVEHIAQLAPAYPAANEMLADHLAHTLPVDARGYYERVTASAVQYAERLLNGRLLANDPLDRCAQIAWELVYKYKDHGFVISSREATALFGADVLKLNSGEYAITNQVYGSLDFMERFIRRHLNKDLHLPARQQPDVGLSTVRPHSSGGLTNVGLTGEPRNVPITHGRKCRPVA